jgi:hypothetical protein
MESNLSMIRWEEPSLFEINDKEWNSFLEDQTKKKIFCKVDLCETLHSINKLYILKLDGDFDLHIMHEINMNDYK